MSGELAFELHALVGRLDRAADRILREHHDITYRRFLALFMVGELGATTQRALAERLDVSEPSVSRMAGVLAGEGLLQVAGDPGGGNRRRLSLTAEGARLMHDCRTLLGRELSAVVASSGIPAEDYLAHTRRLSSRLGDDGDSA